MCAGGPLETRGCPKSPTSPPHNLTYGLAGMEGGVEARDLIKGGGDPKLSEGKTPHQASPLSTPHSKGGQGEPRALR